MLTFAQAYEHAKVVVDFTLIIIQFAFEIIYSIMKKVIKDKPKDISGEIVLVMLLYPLNCRILLPQSANLFPKKDYRNWTWHWARTCAAVHRFRM